MFFIYKITNPSGSIYVGQTSNVDDRIKRYRLLKCSGQIKLFHSLKKYGWDNHIFEIIEECSVNEYHQREIFWIDFYKSNYSKIKDANGLNLCDGGEGNKGYRRSAAVRKGDSERAKQKGISHMMTPEARRKVGDKLKVILKGKYTGDSNPNFGNKWTDEMKKSMSIKKTGCKPNFSQEKRAEITKKVWEKRGVEGRRKQSELSRKAMYNLWGNHREKMLTANRNQDKSKSAARFKILKARKVIDPNTGIVYDTIKEAAAAFNIEKTTLGYRLKKNILTHLRFLITETSSTV